MLRQEFLDVVGEMGQDKNVSCRVSEKGDILVKFRGNKKEWRLLQAVSHYLYGTSRRAWILASCDLNLHSHTADTVFSASVYPPRGISNWRRVRDTRNELFKLLHLKFKRFYVGAERKAQLKARAA